MKFSMRMCCASLRERLTGSQDKSIGWPNSDQFRFSHRRFAHCCGSLWMPIRLAQALQPQLALQGPRLLRDTRIAFGAAEMFQSPQCSWNVHFCSILQWSPMHKLLVCCYLSYLNFVQILLMQPLSWILWPSVVLTAAHSLGKYRRKAWSASSWHGHRRADSDDQSPRAHRTIKQATILLRCFVVGETQLSKKWLQRAKPLQLCSNYHGKYLLITWYGMLCESKAPSVQYHNANDKRCNYEPIRISEQLSADLATQLQRQEANVSSPSFPC